MENLEKYEEQRRYVRAELRKSIIKPTSFEVFKKTPEERALLSSLKSEVKNGVKRNGNDPKKVMNYE